MTDDQPQGRLAGQVMTSLTPAELTPALRSAGLRATLTESRGEGPSVWLDAVGDADCSIQPYEPGEYLVCDAGGELGALDDLARSLSAALTGMGIRHRLEVYDEDHDMSSYLHHDWPLSDPGGRDGVTG
jgi:hypothetical protein